jgi:hypothetical protein
MREVTSTSAVVCFDGFLLVLDAAQAKTAARKRDGSG